MHPRDTKKALSPVISSVILIGIVVAVSLATVAWMSGLSTSFMQIEEMHATNHQWGPNTAYIDITLNNIGTTSVNLDSITVNSQPATATYITGANPINRENQQSYESQAHSLQEQTTNSRSKLQQAIGFST